MLVFFAVLPTAVSQAQPDKIRIVNVDDEPSSEPAEPPDTESEVPDCMKDENATDGKPPVWLPGLEDGHRRALADGRPVLARAGAVWCPACRKLAAEIEKPAVQKELARWSLVYVDIDVSPAEAGKLGVTSIPALRIRTPSGRPVAAQDGLLTAEDLVAWLEKHYEAAQAAPDDVLLKAGKPDAEAVVSLVQQFDDRSAAVREAAIRRLLPYPDVARTAVVKTLHEGRLSARLAALELLGEWKAPLDDLDPWRPETLTAERLVALEKWAHEAPAGPVARPEKLSQEQLAAAAEQIDRMLKATDDEADAMRQRLARLGPALLPEVYARLKQAATDQQRERLLALRYRLVADDTLALRWPGGLLRLSATDSRQRQKAADQLAKRATAVDQRLLLELFSDPDPLVREICLRGLQHIGGKEATAALVDLLADPEPNVRAAVLKQLEETPQPSMVPKVAAYLKAEKDPDLIVHAIRFLRASGGPEALKSLMPLLKHESWQVRAEAAAGIGNADSSFRVARSFSPGFSRSSDDAEQLQADAFVALIDLLEDPDAFVVSRAVEGLAGADMVVAVEPLVKAAAKHPQLATNIVELLANGQKMRPKAVPHLRNFTKHKDAAIRAAAIAGLVRAASDDMAEEITAGLQDAESPVRIAAAAAMFRVLEMQRGNAVQSMRQRGTTGRFAPTISLEPTTVYEPPPSEGLLKRAMRSLGERLRKEKPAAEAAEPPQPPQPVKIPPPAIGIPPPTVVPPPQPAE